MSQQGWKQWTVAALAPLAVVQASACGVDRPEPWSVVSAAMRADITRALEDVSELLPVHGDLRDIVSRLLALERARSACRARNRSVSGSIRKCARALCQ